MGDLFSVEGKTVVVTGGAGGIGLMIARGFVEGGARVVISSRKAPADLSGPITDEGVAVGGGFDSDTATGMMPAAHRVAGVLTSWRS